MQKFSFYVGELAEAAQIKEKQTFLKEIKELFAKKDKRISELLG